MTYKIKLPDGSVINHNGSLREFMLTRDEFKRNCSDGRRKSLQHTLKRGSTYKGYQVLEIIKDKLVKVEKESNGVVNDGDYFKISSKNINVTISKNDTRKILQMYCTRRMTINQVSTEMGLLREELLLILRSFHITKDSTPFLPEDIDSKTTEEMAEIVRLEKKRGFKQKLENNKHIDQEKELKKLHTKEFYFDKFVEAVKEVKDININHYDMKIPPMNRKNTIVATLTDEHFGSKIDSPFNKFNKDIACKRMAKYTKEIIKKANSVGAERIVVEQLGDLVEGVIHVSGRISTDMNGIESCIFASQVISKMLIEIKVNTNADVIELFSVSGNHDRLLESKTESLEEENFERFIVYAIDLIIKNSRVSGIKVNMENMIFGMSLIPMYGSYIAGSHGHNIKKQENAIIELGRRGYKIFQYHQGHFHNLKVENKGETIVITSPSFVGSNSYATKMFLVSKPQQLIHTYNEDGWVGMDVVDLG